MPRKKRLSDRITNSVGGRDLAEFFGAKIAKARAPKGQKKLIKSRATSKQALKSAGKVALTTGSLAVGGALGGAARLASRARKSRKAAGVIGKLVNKKTGRSSSVKHFNRGKKKTFVDGKRVDPKRHKVSAKRKK